MKDEGLRRPPVVDTMIEIMQRRDGKDKTIKIIQYTGKLLIRLSDTNRLKLLALRLQVVPTLAPLVKELSMFRKFIKLGDWVKSGRELMTDKATLVDYVDWYTEIMDDLYLLAKIGTINSKNTRLYERQAELAWYVAILLNISSKMDKPRTHAWKIDMAKLSCDFVFCTVDVFQPKCDPSWQIVSGLLSAVFGYYKIWLKVR